MIIWRGWGVLGVLILALCLGAGSAIGQAMSSRSNDLTYVGLGLGAFVAAVGIWFAGQRLNVTGPARQLALFEAGAAAREQALLESVENGTYQPPAGMAAPRSLDEARGQARALLQLERAKLAAGAGRNRHTLFFVPLQYFAVVPVSGGVAALVFGLLGR